MHKYLKFFFFKEKRVKSFIFAYRQIFFSQIYSNAKFRVECRFVTSPSPPPRTPPPPFMATTIISPHWDGDLKINYLSSKEKWGEKVARAARQNCSRAPPPYFFYPHNKQKKKKSGQSSSGAFCWFHPGSSFFFILASFSSLQQLAADQSIGGSRGGGKLTSNLSGTFIFGKQKL